MGLKKIAELCSKGGNTTIGYQSGGPHEFDCYIVASEDGFSPLGAMRSFFSKELNVDEATISQLASWNRFENPEVSFIALPARGQGHRLRGLLLAPGENSKCYAKFAEPRHSKPYRDFYYNVSYECIKYASTHFNSKRLGITHLSSSGRFHEDIATCTAEALAHYCDGSDNPHIDTFAFVGCCIEERHLHGIRRLNAERATSQHREILTTQSMIDGFEMVSLDWSANPNE